MSALFSSILTIFLVVSPINNVDPVQLAVNGPLHPVTAALNEDIVLHCHLYPRTSAQNMEIKWFRSQNSSYVYFYHSGKDHLERQQPEYQGRTEFLKDGLGDGKIALKILNVSLSDEGQYHCSVKNGSFHQEAMATLNMKVTASGTGPHIYIEGYQDRSIRIICQSNGWYPKPEILWRHPNEKHLLSRATKNSQKHNGLFEVQNDIILTGSSNQNLTCVIRNILLNQEKEATIHLANHLFPKTSHWIVVLCVSLMAVLGLIVVILYLFNQEKKLAAELKWRQLVMPVEKGA
ncbi:putative selection and upkeep of intraepithelial T-cells protein 1 homolog isoform X2 [Hemicordylus capensis]|uniref:putative selection and upkeep of intraepithelial T-cells protein 1 homolog isoform X2 n=1 Tax=Hemicordylus capensis TaxID=884348 RepID=UPI00230359CC|nr:putative selection and upkeep of intraepithelial T-cells protein 1 homolog isoform X2 [Hemicordylus capensis]